MFKNKHGKGVLQILDNEQGIKNLAELVQYGQDIYK